MKTCTKCGVAKELSEFTLVSKSKDGHDNICQPCRRKIYNEMVLDMTNKQIIKREKLGMHKICKMCKLDKPLSEYPIDRSHSDGHKTVCEPCNIIRNQGYYQNSSQSKAKYRANHRLETNLYHREQCVKTKTLVMTHYSDGECSCVLCGESRLPCLTIDHINGGGTKHRRSLNIPNGGGLHFYKWLLTNNYPEGYRTLCWNCQFIVEDEKRKKLLDKTN